MRQGARPSLSEVKAKMQELYAQKPIVFSTWSHKFQQHSSVEITVIGKMEIIIQNGQSIALNSKLIILMKMMKNKQKWMFEKLNVSLLYLLSVSNLLL